MMRNKFTILFLVSYTVLLFFFGFYIQRSQSAESLNPQILEVTVTAYSPSKSQTRGHERQMASGKYASVRSLWEMRYVAVSRDLKEKYNLKWGDKIYIAFEVQDLMAKSVKGKEIREAVDLFLRNKDLAKEFGRQEREIIILK